MKEKTIVYLYLSCLLCSGCASLTKSQLSEVNAFGQLSSHFSAYPGAIITTCDEVHRQGELFKANSEPLPKNHLDAVDEALAFKEITALITPKIDLSFKIIDQYGQALVLLTSDKHSKALDTVTKGLGTNLDGLIVQYNKADKGNQLKTGLGSAVAALITLGGDVYIRKRQADEVRKIVPEADQVIGLMTANLLEYLDAPPKSDGNTLPQRIAGEEGRLRDSYNRFLNPYSDHIRSGGEGEKSGQWGNIEHRRFASLSDDQAYMDLLEKLHQVETLRVQCIAAIKSLRAAHTKMLADISQKEDLKDIAAEVQTYGDDLKNMFSTIKSIK